MPTNHHNHNIVTKYSEVYAVNEEIEVNANEWAIIDPAPCPSLCERPFSLFSALFFFWGFSLGCPHPSSEIAEIAPAVPGRLARLLLLPSAMGRRTRGIYAQYNPPQPNTARNPNSPSSRTLAVILDPTRNP